MWRLTPAWLLAGALVLLGTAARAAEVVPVRVTSAPFELESLQGHAFLWLEDGGAATFEDVASHRSSWQPARTSRQLHLGYLTHPVWLVWDVENASELRRNLRFTLGTAQLDHLDVFVARADGSVTRARAGDHVALLDRSVSTSRPTFDLDLDAREGVRVYARFRSSGAITADGHGTDVARFRLSLFDETRVTGLVLGVLLVLMLYHLVGFGTTGERLNLWYSIQTGAGIVIIAASDGSLASIGLSGSFLGDALPHTATAVALGATSQFLRSFWSTRGLEDRCLLGLATLGFAAVPATLALPVRTSALAVQTCAVALMCFSMVLSLRQLPKQSAAGRIAGATWILLGASALYLVASVRGVVSHLETARSLFWTAILVERLMLSIPLAARIRRLRTHAAAKSAEARAARERTELESEQRLQLETQLQEREEELRKSQSLEVVGQLAGGLTHDFNNTLQVVLTTADLVRPSLAGSPEDLELLDAMARTAEQASALTGHLLMLSRKQPQTITPIELNDTLGAMLPLLRRILGATVQVNFRGSDEPLSIRGDRAQLEQAIMNLALNARDAMPDGGSLELRCYGAKRVPGSTQGLGASEAIVEVQDSGHGMSEELRAKIFDPFFTTKPAGSGTGLGLAMVKNMLDAHDGFCEVWSAPGEGSRFQLHFPRIQATSNVASREADAVGPIRGERILVVEDHPEVRHLMVRVLRQAGYEVETAADGEAALRLFAAPNAAPIRLLVSDLVMPGLPGWKLLEEVRSQYPKLPCLLCSGYSEEFVLRRITLDVQTQLLPKPFDVAALLYRVRAILSANPGATEAASQAH